DVVPEHDDEADDGEHRAAEPGPGHRDHYRQRSDDQALDDDVDDGRGEAGADACQCQCQIEALRSRDRDAVVVRRRGDWLHAMTVRAVAEEGKGTWDDRTSLVERAGRRPERLGSPGVRRLGALYRATAADLALARRLYPGEPVVADLETIVGRGRSLVYGTRTPAASLRAFAFSGYWRLVASHAVPIATSAVCLFPPALLAGAWAVRDPGSAAGLVPVAYRSVTEPRPHDAGSLGLTPAENTALASEIFTNNIRVTFLAF